MKYITLNPIAEAGLLKLPDTFEKTEDFKEADAVLVRSAQMADLEFPPQLEAIARAGAGVNNIPVEACASKGIVVFNTPGANANGVKELTILSLLMGARDIKGGMNWVDENKGDEAIGKTMEKAKAKYGGNEILGKTIGIIGLGAIGVLVANAAIKLGMKVVGYDPYLSVYGALQLDHHVNVVKTTAEVYEAADYVTVHVPENDVTKGMLNKEAFDAMKDGVVVLNIARAGLVNDDDLAEALASGKIKKYITDVPDYKTANMENVVAFPHLGASTDESETNCAIMAVEELVDFMENGNITNSVNYPSCTLGPAKKPVRICVFHKNVPKVLSSLTSLLGSVSANISDMVSKARGDYAYAIFDLDSPIADATVGAISVIPDVIRVKVIKK